MKQIARNPAAASINLDRVTVVTGIQNQQMHSATAPQYAPQYAPQQMPQYAPQYAPQYVPGNTPQYKN